MKRNHSKAALLVKRVKKVQGRAKFVGFLYLLGAIALAAAVVALPMLSGTVLGNAMLPVLTFYAPIVALFEGGAGSIMANLQGLTEAGVAELLVSLFYAFLLLGVVINMLRAFKKLKWLFKRRASYTNGFNRNMYAMDDLGKRFSGSFGALVNFYLLIYLLSAVNAEVTVTMYGLITVGAAAFIHLFAGIIGARVTLFTLDDNVQEIRREFGVFTYFVRNLIQIAAVGAIVYFFLPVATLGAELPKLTQALIAVDVAAIVNIPVLVELVAWLCIFVLVKHATASTEFNRDGIDGAGMKNFAVFSFFAAIAIAALVVLPMVGVVPAVEEMNMQIVTTAGIALGAFLLDVIIKSRRPKAKKKKKAAVNNEEVGVEEYLRENAEMAKYNNTII
jgi:hypothetical protein